MKSNNKICILLILIVIIILILYFYLNLAYYKNQNKDLNKDLNKNDNFENLNQNIIDQLGNDLKNVGNFYSHSPPVKCKYIKIERITPAPVAGTTLSETYMNIARIYIYDINGNQLQSGLSASGSPIYENYDASKLIDYTNTDGFAHTDVSSSTVPNPYFKIDLNNETDISKIIILNRQNNCCKNSMIGTRLSVYDNGNRIVYTTNINDIKDKYIFNIQNSIL